MTRTALAFIVLATGAGAHENLRGDTATSISALTNIIADLTLRVDTMEQELKELRNHRMLEGECELTFMEASGECLLTRTLTIDPTTEETSASIPALKVYGSTLLEGGELVVEDEATFRDDVTFEGDFEVAGTVYLHGDFEVCGLTTLHSDVIVEMGSKKGHDSDIHNLRGRLDQPEVIIRGELTVEEDVIFEEDFDVEGDVSFSEDLEVQGDCIGC